MKVIKIDKIARDKIFHGIVLYMGACITVDIIPRAEEKYWQSNG